MNEVRKKALSLRIRGYSYNEINKVLGVPKSTLSGWFSNLVLSHNAQLRLEKRKGIGTDVLIKRNKLQTVSAQKRAAQTEKNASQKIKDLSKRDLMIIGAALYWAEGYKKLRIVNGKERTHHVVSLSNTDPVLIQTFIKFLLEVLEVPRDKIILNMRLFPHINENNSRKYWKKITGLEEGNFKHTTFLTSISSKRKRPYNRLPHGTLQVYYSSTKKFYEIMGFIKGIKSAIT